jgi:hypothetical protein
MARAIRDCAAVYTFVGVEDRVQFQIRFQQQAHLKDLLITFPLQFIC